MCCEQALSKTRGSALLRVAFSRNPIKHCALAEFRSSGGYFFIYGVFWYVNSLQKMPILKVLILKVKWHHRVYGDGYDDRHFVGIMCWVKWRRFIVRVIGTFKKMSITDLPTKRFKRYQSDKHLSEFLPTRWRQITNWHWYRTKLRHCHPMYNLPK